METLTSKEVDVLIEALDKWEQAHDGIGRFMGSLLNSVMSDKMTEDEKRKLAEKEAESERKVQLETKRRKEVSILLKAKLIGIRQMSETQMALSQNQTRTS